MKKDKDLTWFDRVATNLRLEWAVSDMEVKLIEAIQKDVKNGATHLEFINGENDKYKEVEKRIKIIREFQQSWLETIEENRVLDNLVFRVTKQFHIMDEKIKTLEKENETLKQNITI